MRNEIELTDEQIEERFRELCTWADPDNLIMTRDTLEDFVEARETYRDYGRIEDYELSTGERYVVTEDVQTRKGEQRRHVVVIDFGSIRVVAN